MVHLLEPATSPTETCDASGDLGQVIKKGAIQHQQRMTPAAVVLLPGLLGLLLAPTSSGFLAPVPTAREALRRRHRPAYRTPSSSSSIAATSGTEAGSASTDADVVQWELFRKHHARGSWRGIWTTVDYMGDVLDETVASVDLALGQDEAGMELVRHTHTIAVGATKSDCATCFDSEQTRTLPVASYAQGRLGKVRCAACGLVNGPTLLKSGAMATELCLRHGDARLRAVLQHAPVWAQGVEPAGSGPPQGLRLVRVLYSREALRDEPPTPQSEAPLRQELERIDREEQSGPSDDLTGRRPVVFHRPVSPFSWHKRWAGTSWTWGPQSGDRGWVIEELDDGGDGGATGEDDTGGDAWHGAAPVGEWNLRLPGGILLQCPRIIAAGAVGLCRMAWLPTSDVLLRLEAGVVALQPLEDEEEDAVVRFAPPALASLRCDVLQKIGDLEGQPQFLRAEQKQAEGESEVQWAGATTAVADTVTGTEVQCDAPTPATVVVSSETTTPKPTSSINKDVEFENPLDALQL